MNELLVKKANLLDQAKAALVAGNLEEGRRLRQEAEQTQALIDESAAVDGMLAKSTNAARPPLPGADPQSGMFITANPVPAEPQGTASIEAAYVRRFGEPDAAVKAILAELHGKDYRQAYWDQRRAFAHYLRRGDKGLGVDEYKMLKSIVLTPNAVHDALTMGADNVAVLKATLVEAIDTLGGFAVPVDFQARVIERMKGQTIMRGRANVDQTSRDMVEIPVSTGGDDQYTSAVRVTWVDETPVAGQSATNLTFGLESIPIHTVMAESALGRNMLEDAAFDVEGYLTRKFAEASAIDEDNKFLVGVGAGTPQGILPGGTNALGLTEVVSGAAADVTWDGLINLMYAVPSQYRNKAVWIGERATYRNIAKLRTSTTGEYLWQPFQYVGGAEFAPPRLMGSPTLEQEGMPSIGANTYPLIYGDPGAYQIFDRVGMTVERYLDSATARTNTIIYVMRRRLGAQVLEPWRLAVQKCASS